MIYVLVPAHNEAPTVGLLLWKVRQAFTAFNREYQIIVVNDASTDTTDDVLAPYVRALPLTLLTNRRRQGYARSLELLLRAAIQRTDRPRRDYAVTLQADFSDSPDDLVELVKRLEGGADIAVADRRAQAGTPPLARLARRALNAVARARLGVPVGDCTGTMRAYRLAVIERLVRDAGEKPFLSGDGWSADLDLLAKAARHARRIEAVPVATARPDGARASRSRPVRDAWTALRGLGRIRDGLDGKGAAAPASDIEPAETTETVRAQGQRPDGSTPRGGDRERRGDGRERRGERRDGQPRRKDQRREARQERGRQDRPAATLAARPAAPMPAPAPTPAVEAAEAAAPDGTTGVTGLPERDTPAASESQGQRPRRKRRRRGRGRGRGRGQGPRPGTGTGDSEPDTSADPPAPAA